MSKMWVFLLLLKLSTVLYCTSSQGDFTAIVDLPEGEHEYKFYVDGGWLHNPDEVCLVLLSMSVLPPHVCIMYTR